MSYFLFGTVQNSFQTTDQEANIAWQIVRIGMINGLHILLGPNVHQKVVHEMMLMQEGTRGIPFLITSSPIEDTSDSLISPRRHPKTWLNKISDLLSRLHQWAMEILKLDGVQIITIGMTEGYDDNFEEIDLRLQDFRTELVHRLEEHGDIPSLKVHLRRG